MTRPTQTALTAAMAVIALPGVALAQTCNTTFTGPTGNLWQNPLNWSNQAPDETKVGCVPVGKTVKVTGIPFCNGGVNAEDTCVTDTDCPGAACVEDRYVAAKAVVVDGTLDIRAYSSVSIFEDSDVDGTVDLQRLSELRLAASLTITGTGTLVGDRAHYYPNTGPLVRAADVCAGGGNAGELCEDAGDCPSSTCDPVTATLTIASGTEAIGRWKFTLPVINNGTVTSDSTTSLTDDLFGIRLTADGNGGSGDWVGDDGVMTFDGSLTGSGTLITKLQGRIAIEDDSTTNNSVSYIPTGGTLEINNNFTTTGALDLTAGGTVKVKNGNKAIFSQ